jgi:E3 ubiquitin-protein ligase UBR4
VSATLIPGARVTEAGFAQALEGWWENMAAVGRPEPTSARLRLALGDAAMLLGRFATGASFSVDCNGGRGGTFHHVILQS